MASELAGSVERVLRPVGKALELAAFVACRRWKHPALGSSAPAWSAKVERARPEAVPGLVALDIFRRDLRCSKFAERFDQGRELVRANLPRRCSQVRLRVRLVSIHAKVQPERA